MCRSTLELKEGGGEMDEFFVWDSKKFWKFLRKHLEVRYVYLALVVNGIAVYWINLQEGGTAGATTSGIVQLCVSGALAGFTVPYTKRKARFLGYGDAYFYGSIAMASFVTLVGLIAHFVFRTPDLFWTVVWNFGLNAVAGATLVALKRNKRFFPLMYRRGIDWL